MIKYLDVIVKDLEKKKWFYDLLVRSDPNFVEGWSDLDISIIVNECNYKVLKEIRELYKEWKKEIPIKIDLMVINKEDKLTNKWHFHGGYRRMYILELMKKGRTIFGKYEIPKKIKPRKWDRIGAFKDMCKKMKELRETIVKWRTKSCKTDLESILIHVMKRVKTIGKCAVDIHGFHYDNLKDYAKKLKELYGSNVLIRYIKIRSSWNKIKKTERLLKYFVDEAEKIFKKAMEDAQYINY